MRKKLGGIPPDPCGDCMIAFFCMVSYAPPLHRASRRTNAEAAAADPLPRRRSPQDCMICQMRRELKHRELSGSGCVEEYYVKSRVDAATATVNVAPGIPVMEKDSGKK